MEAVVFTSTELNKEFRIHKDRIVIGSVESADVRVTGEDIAPVHAVIEITAQSGNDIRGMIFDLASPTGVFLNGERIITSSLKNGDRIRIGQHNFTFRMGDAPLTTAREHHPAPIQEDLKPLLLEEGEGVQKIFDHVRTEAAEPALEIVMSWKGVILDVSHFTNKKKIFIGSTRDCDFIIPPVLKEKKFPLIRNQNGKFTLHSDKIMTGVVQKDRKLHTLTELNSQNGIPLNKDDFAKISVGEIDFYLGFTVSPPILLRRKLLDRDPLFSKILSGSIVFTIAMMIALANMRVSREVETEELPDRIASILYHPEKYTYKRPSVPPPTEAPVQKKPTVTKLDIKPKGKQMDKIPKELDYGQTGKKVADGSQAKKKGQNRSQKEAKEGRGARAKGKEGTRGSKTAKKFTEHQEAASRPSATGGTGRGGGKSQVGGSGNIDILKGAGKKIEDLLGTTTEKLGKGGEKLKGFGGFETQGSGGLAISSKGSGGGGKADSLGGLSDQIGPGGGRVGTGLGAAGQGTGIIGGKRKVILAPGDADDSVVMGSIDADAVEAALLRHRDEFRLCYEREINAGKPALAGRVSTSFVIGPSGRVDQAGILATSLKNINTEKCILKVLRRIDFPRPRGGGIVQVTYPFKFRPVGG